MFNSIEHAIKARNNQRELLVRSLTQAQTPSQKTKLFKNAHPSACSFNGSNVKGP